MSMPAVVPHFRPAGNWPQLRLTCVAGFGNPSPVTGLPAAADADGAAATARSPDPPAPHAARRSVALAPTTRRKIFGVDICLLEYVLSSRRAQARRAAVRLSPIAASLNVALSGKTDDKGRAGPSRLGLR